MDNEVAGLFRNIWRAETEPVAREIWQLHRQNSEEQVRMMRQLVQTMLVFPYLSGAQLRVLNAASSVEQTPPQTPPQFIGKEEQHRDARLTSAYHPNAASQPATSELKVSHDSKHRITPGGHFLKPSGNGGSGSNHGQVALKSTITAQRPRADAGRAYGQSPGSQAKPAAGASVTPVMIATRSQGYPAHTIGQSQAMHPLHAVLPQYGAS